MEKWLVCHLFIVQIHFAMENLKHPQGVLAGLFSTHVQLTTSHTPKTKKRCMFPKPPKLGRSSTPSIFPLAVLPPCHSYLAVGSRLRWNAAHQWCAWSRWDPGTWETDPAPGCAVRMRRWWEMCRLVIFFSWIQLIKLWVCSETCFGSVSHVVL